MAEYKLCANEEMAIYVLEFIKREYEENHKDAGVKKYVEALQMGIEALAEVDRQKLQIKKLENIERIGTKTIETQQAEIKRLEKEVDRLSQVVLYNDGVTEMKVTEANKEVAERLKTKLKDEIWGWVGDMEYEPNRAYAVGRVWSIINEMAGAE